MTAAGFPHSGTPGSTPTCGSPRLFAACRALLRLSVPRHPPCALVRLTGYAHTRHRCRVDLSSPPILLGPTLVLASSLDATYYPTSQYPCFQVNQVGRECSS